VHHYYNNTRAITTFTYTEFHLHLLKLHRFTIHCSESPRTNLRWLTTAIISYRTLFRNFVAIFAV